MTAPRHVDVGAYVLGILDEPDEAAYEQHFAQCEQCRREFIELADLPAILDTLKPPTKEPERPAPTLPPLDTLIDFKQLSPPGGSPAVPPQQRPAGATQPHKLPHPAPIRPPANGKTAGAPPRTNGAGRHLPVPPPKPGVEGTGGRHTPVPPPKQGNHPQAPAARPGTSGLPRAEGTGQRPPATRPGTSGHPKAEGTGQHKPAARPGTSGHPKAEGTGQHKPAARPGTGGHPRAEGTGRQTPVARPGTGGHPKAEGTGRHVPPPINGARPGTGPRSQAEGTGQHKPAAPPNPGTGRHLPAARPQAGTRPAPASKAAPAKPPSKPRDPGPTARAGSRRGRKPVWLAATAVVAIALSVGVVIGITSGGSGDRDQVADRNTSAPTTPPSGAVAGAHVVSGTDPDTGVTAIITIEPVGDGTEIDLALYEVDGPQEGVLIAVSRFGERVEVADWKVPAGDAGQGEAVRASGVASLAQQDIIRFELHGDGIEPLLVVPT